MTSNIISGIYAIKGPNDSIYVGSAVSISKRWSTHLCDLRKGRHYAQQMQRAWNKYGEEAFSFQVLEYVSDSSALIAREQFWLDRIFSEYPEDRIYNTLRTAGNRLGYRFTEESKAKIRARLKARGRGWEFTPEIRRNMSIAAKKKVFSKQHRENLSIARRGWKMSDASKDKRCYTLTGRVYTIISPEGILYRDVFNITQFAQEHGLCRSSLNDMLSGARPSQKHHKGWRGIIQGEQDESELFKPLPRKLHTFISPEGKVYKNIENVKAFARQHGLDDTKLGRVAAGKPHYRQHKGWTGYIQDPE